MRADYKSLQKQKQMVIGAWRMIRVGLCRCLRIFCKNLQKIKKRWSFLTRLLKQIPMQSPGVYKLPKELKQDKSGWKLFWQCYIGERNSTKLFFPRISDSKKLYFLHTVNML